MALEEAIHRVLGGRRTVLMITGEPGIGKTRMLEELAARVTAVGGSAAWGRTWEVGLTPAFWPWMQILGALEADGDSAPSLGGIDQRSDAAARLAWFGGVGGFLVRRTAKAPIALLF